MEAHFYCCLAATLFSLAHDSSSGHADLRHTRATVSSASLRGVMLHL